jgi:hypothetical protein
MEGQTVKWFVSEFAYRVASEDEMRDGRGCGMAVKVFPLTPILINLQS